MKHYWPEQNYMENLRQNRIQAFAFIAVALTALCISCLWVGEIYMFESSGKVIRPDNMINPNNAPVASLRRLPGIGLTRAQAIIAYRNDLINGSSRPFYSSVDLQKVSGIGPKTAEDIGQWLKFEQE
jgi:competence ComEA-like helix-hairpin-helix protein